MPARDNADLYMQIVETVADKRVITFTLEDPVIYLNGLVEVQQYGDLTMEYFGPGSRCVFENHAQLYTIYVSRVGFGHHMRPKELVSDPTQAAQSSALHPPLPPTPGGAVGGGGGGGGGDGDDGGAIAGGFGPMRQGGLSQQVAPHSYRVTVELLIASCCLCIGGYFYYYYGQPPLPAIVYITGYFWNTTDKFF